MKTKVAALAAISVLAVVIVAAALSLSPSHPPQQTLVGSLFASDAGRSHGGFEYTAQWNATLLLTGNDDDGGGT